MTLEQLEKNSYSPYSLNAKSCIIESKNGKFFKGVRVENVSYPLTIPAIQAACCICLSEGEIPSKLYVKDKNLDQQEFWVREFDLKIIESQDIDHLNSENLFKRDAISNSLSFLKILLEMAVVPASDFPVSAILFTDSGYFTGVNIEVSDWTKGLCAERVALAKAIAEGITAFKSIEIHTRKGEVSSPCGACRQVIIEHLPYHPVILHHADGTKSEHMSVDLLPFSFKSFNLKR